MNTVFTGPAASAIKGWPALTASCPLESFKLLSMDATTPAPDASTLANRLGQQLDLATLEASRAG